MYYIHEYEGQKVHIYVKSTGVYIKNRLGTMLSVLDEPRTIKQAERLFNARFRWVTNDDKIRTRVFL